MTHLDNCKCPQCQQHVEEPELLATEFTHMYVFDYTAIGIYWTGKVWRVKYELKTPQGRKVDVMLVATWNNYCKGRTDDT